MSGAVALAAGCGGGGGSTSTAPVPPDRLAVTLRAPGVADFRVDLDCGVADRAACVAVVDALRATQKEERCVAAPRGGAASILVDGMIDGSAVEAIVTRRTDCEIALYDRIVTGAGL